MEDPPPDRTMAIIDTFLNLMAEKRAERLILASDSVPVLLKGEEEIMLSMPALHSATLRRIVSELSADESLADDDGAQLGGRIDGIDGAEFGYHCSRRGSDLRIELHSLQLGSPPTDADDADLLTRAVAAFANGREPDAAPLPTASPQASPAAADLSGIIEHALALNASDVFLSAGKSPRVRANGVLKSIDTPAPDEARILSLLPGEPFRRELETKGSVDFALVMDLADGPRRFRVNVFRHLDGVAAALRPIRRQIPSLSDLHLPADLVDLTEYSGGLVLVTGPSGSGKSTTLATLIDHLNRSQARHVITLEDPIEFEHREGKCLIHQRELGTNVESFSSGLHAALRENPDVILLGEIRELATISAALTAAETGHLVLATLHSGNASLAVNRMVDVFPGHQQAHVRIQLASSLRAVVSQRLVRTRDGRLMPAIERLIVTPAVANGIREGQEHFLRNAMLTGSEEGMITLERSLASMVRKGLLTRDAALRHAADPKAFQHLLE